MAQQQLPSQEKMNAFAAKLKDFRGGLPNDEQHILDAMVASAFQTADKPADKDVQGYWWAYPAYPAWYGAPVYYGTPWVGYYGYGYPYYY